eukprot:scaffold1643_cov210-Chaetoceros_neogracile.AAC.3
MAIYKSRIKLKSVYHRIMFLMSTCDIFASTVVALTTLMMPKDMIYKHIFPQNWAIYGTQGTCTAQGFIFFTFSFLTFSCDIVLSVYYLCSIKFGMSDQVFSLRVEWVCYVLFLFLSLCISIQRVVQGDFNPSLERAWCGNTEYPYSCQGDGCIRGGNTSRGNIVITKIFASCMLFVVLLSLGSIVLHVYQRERSCTQEFQPKTTKNVIAKDSDALNRLQEKCEIFASDVASCHSSEEEIDEVRLDSMPKRSYYNDEKVPRIKYNADDTPSCFITSNQKDIHFEETKIIIKQAAAYMCVYIVMVILIILGSSMLIDNIPFGVVHAIIRPSHGTFNMLIFLYHKYFNLKKNQKFLTYCEALGIIFRGGGVESVLIFETMSPVINDVAIRGAALYAQNHRGLYSNDEEEQSNKLDLIEN